MLTRTSISVLLIIAVAVWAAFLWVLGIELTWDHAKPYSLTLAVLSSSFWIFDKYLWKRWPFSELGGRPDLSGTWQVELHSSYQNPRTGQRRPIVNGYLAVRQTYTTLSIRLMTKEAESFLVASSVEKQPDGTTYIYGVYQSDPSILLRGIVSEIHYGSFKYKIVGNPVYELIGHYWTDRHTSGSVKVYNRTKKYIDSHSYAERMVEEEVTA